MSEQNELVMQQLMPFINFAYVNEQRPTMSDVNEWISIPLQVEHGQASTTGVNDMFVLMGHFPTLKTLISGHELRVSVAQDVLSQAANCVGIEQSSSAADTIPGPSQMPGFKPSSAPLFSDGAGLSGTGAMTHNSPVTEATSAFAFVPPDVPCQQGLQLTSATTQKSYVDETLSAFGSAPNQVPLQQVQHKEADKNEQQEVSVKIEAGAAALSSNIFECPECGKPYENAKTLQGHRRKHLGEHELVFRCSCGMRFSRKSGLSYHLRRKPNHTSLEKEKPSVPEWIQDLSPSGDLFNTPQKSRKRPASRGLGFEEELSEDDDVKLASPSANTSVPEDAKSSPLDAAVRLICL
ncbi:hypothetical protein AAVH_03393 [Aphelenchoides avenae]|nr:hypothetical protein AAVH_03393 [Aphelenchus avenae]